MVDFLEYDASSKEKVRINRKWTRLMYSLDASVAIRSKMSLTKELRIAIALLEIPVSGWTCLRTIQVGFNQFQIRYMEIEVG